MARCSTEKKGRVGPLHAAIRRVADYFRRRKMLELSWRQGYRIEVCNGSGGMRMFIGAADEPGAWHFDEVSMNCGSTLDAYPAHILTVRFKA